MWSLSDNKGCLKVSVNFPDKWPALKNIYLSEVLIYSLSYIVSPSMLSMINYDILIPLWDKSVEHKD